MKLATLTLLFFMTGSIINSQGLTVSLDEARFMITVDGKKGFINTAGEIVIAPQFQDALEFSEGLCAVRVSGRYGFVNTKGELTIPATYDYASMFMEGLAVVYLDGKPLFITPEGKVAFESGYAYMSHFTDSLSEVRTYSGRVGLINHQGVLVVDTVYGQIERVGDNLAIVHGPHHQTYDSDDQKRNLQVSVVDMTGKMLFPYGKFESIRRYSEGYFSVQFPERKRVNITTDAIVNTRGEVVLSLPAKQESWIQGGVHQGVVRVALPKRKSGGHYDAYLTLDGKVMYGNKNTYSGTDFKDNVAFVGDKDFKYSIINRKGEIISKEKYRLPGWDGNNPFQNGKAVVKFADNTCGVIDTLANVLLKTSYQRVFPDYLLEDQYLFFEGEGDSDEPRFGMINLKGEVVIPAVMQGFDTRGYINNLLQALVDGKLTYFSRDGKTVWQDPSEEKAALGPLNIDYMNRGYFYANYNYTGHPAESEHAEPRWVTDDKQFKPMSVNLVVYPDDHEVDFFRVARGMRVEVANTRADTVVFNAQDSRLYMKVQAMDKDGKWRDIEYLPSSWCGNSYHTVELPPQRYWTFIAPVYEGAIPTKMRVALTLIDPEAIPEPSRNELFRYRRDNEITIYSNEFSGSINPAQFWRKEEYTAAGIMDPYND
jgi:hypothetical protein